MASRLIRKMEFTLSVRFSWPMSLAKSSCKRLVNKPASRVRKSKSRGTSSAPSAAPSYTYVVKNAIAATCFDRPRARQTAKPQPIRFGSFPGVTTSADQPRSVTGADDRVTGSWHAISSGALQPDRIKKSLQQTTKIFRFSFGWFRGHQAIGGAASSRCCESPPLAVRDGGMVT